MKKILSLLTAMIAVAVLFTACSKSPEKVLDRKDGKWDAIITNTISIDGSEEERYVEVATFIFDDNKFTAISSAGESETGTWSASKDQVTLVIDGDALVLDVLKSNKKDQEWQSIEKENYQGMIVEYKTNIKLSR